MRPKVKLTELTVYEFFHQLAMLGGSIGRKHNGEPVCVTDRMARIPKYATNAPGNRTYQGFSMIRLVGKDAA